MKKMRTWTVVVENKNSHPIKTYKCETHRQAMEEAAEITSQLNMKYYRVYIK